MYRFSPVSQILWHAKQIGYNYIFFHLAVYELRSTPLEMYKQTRWVCETIWARWWQSVMTASLTFDFFFLSPSRTNRWRRQRDKKRDRQNIVTIVTLIPIPSIQCIKEQTKDDNNNYCNESSSNKLRFSIKS